ncbi:MAG TPA: RNase adaptor protein RapZ, partial [Syntrophaceae bacterium]|nr:RNase adaptor protein RapZ [Syntrophaceae bacterium]
PYFVPSLKDLDGEEPEVIDYVMKWKETEKFLKKFHDLLCYLIPLYEKEGKSYLTIAIGCTGGRHRSVAIAKELKKLFDSRNYPITLTHRDMHLE